MLFRGRGLFGARQGFACVVSGALLSLFLITFSTPSQAAEWTVDSFDDAVDAVPGDGTCRTAGEVCSLRAAVQEANAVPGADSIQLPAGTYGLSLTTPDENEAASGDLDILDSLTIAGAGATTTIIDGMLGDRIFDIVWDDAKQTAVTLRNLTLIRGRISGDLKSGGAIYSDAHLRLEDVVLNDNAALGKNSRGGGIYNDEGRLEMLLVTLSGNAADPVPRLPGGGRGGGIASSGYLSMEACTIERSRAVYGAGLHLSDGLAFISDSTITNNVSNRHGGGLHIGDHSEDGVMLGATAVITNSRIEANIVDGAQKPDLNADPDAPTARGGGVFILASSLVYLVDDLIKSNDAARECLSCNIDGGGIANEDGTVVVHRSVFEDNGAARWGGAIYNGINQAFLVSESIFRGNALKREGSPSNPLSGSMGGAIASESDIRVSNSLITGNRSYHGSAISGSGTFDNVTIVDNTSRGDGALFVPGDYYQVALNHVTLARNVTSAGGANIHNPFAGGVRAKNSIIAEPGTSDNCMGQLVSDGNNVISDASCFATPQASDLIADPLLGALADNGGFSATALLSADSPARNKIATADCAYTDQRLLVRSGDMCDAGAADSDAVAGQFGTLGFSATAMDAAESSGNLTIEVARSDNATGPVSVDFLITDGSAVAGENDYTPPSPHGTLTWDGSDNAPKTITIQIHDDAIPESSETFEVRLLAPRDGAQSAANNMLTVTITDNDGAPATPSTPSGGGGGGGAAWSILALALISLLSRAYLSNMRPRTIRHE